MFTIDAEIRRMVCSDYCIRMRHLVILNHIRTVIPPHELIPDRKNNHVTIIWIYGSMRKSVKPSVHANSITPRPGYCLNSHSIILMNDV